MNHPPTFKLYSHDEAHDILASHGRGATQTDMPTLEGAAVTSEPDKDGYVTLCVLGGPNVSCQLGVPEFFANALPTNEDAREHLERIMRAEFN